MPPPHVLVMSATPIPRTLALIAYGDLDVSVIGELPPGRLPVDTFLIGEDKRQRLNAFIEKQCEARHQVYIVCPTVEESDLDSLKSAESFAQTLRQAVFPHRRVGLLHGKMKQADKDAALGAFSRGETDILVATTVVEVGVDVPNATLMVIENADRFGLSQLHQLRGRVGRGSAQSYCVLVSGNRNEQTRKRLKALCATTDGFKIAEEDLALRGPAIFWEAASTDFRFSRSPIYSSICRRSWKPSRPRAKKSATPKRWKGRSMPPFARACMPCSGKAISLSIKLPTIFPRPGLSMHNPGRFCIS